MVASKIITTRLYLAIRSEGTVNRVSCYYMCATRKYLLGRPHSINSMLTPDRLLGTKTAKYA
jgi:hypothetical protein